MLLKNGLTIKQDRFVKKFVETGNGTQAALEAYDTENKVSAGAIAVENLEKPLIREQVELALKANSIDLNSVMGNLKDVAIKEVSNVSADAKIKANIELLKLMNAYPDKKSSHLNLTVKADLSKKTFSEAKNELQAIDTLSGEVIEDIEAND